MSMTMGYLKSNDWWFLDGCWTNPRAEDVGEKQYFNFQEACNIQKKWDNIASGVIKSDIQNLVGSCSHINRLTLELADEQVNGRMGVRLCKDDTVNITLTATSHFNMDEALLPFDVELFLEENQQDNLIEFLILLRKKRNNFHRNSNPDLDFKILRGKGICWE